MACVTTSPTFDRALDIYTGRTSKPPGNITFPAVSGQSSGGDEASRYFLHQAVSDDHVDRKEKVKSFSSDFRADSCKKQQGCWL